MGTGPKSWVVCFLGLPEDFRRAHRSELEDLAAQAVWAEMIDALPKRFSPDAIVLNLDEKDHSKTELWEALRARFPRADLIGISSRDSAVLAMRCLREGFSDFLTQPVSSDELALCLLRSRQRRDTDGSGIFPYGDLSRTLAHLAGSGSEASLKQRTLSVLQTVLGGSGAQWSNHPRNRKVRQTRKILRASNGKRRVSFRCQHESHGRVVVGGLSSKPSRQLLDQAAIILEHAELALMNLRRVEKLKRQTFVDDLTGLYNSRYLRFALEAAVVEFEQRRGAFSLLFIDVDKFKLVNDTHGHLVGSECLTALGKIIKHSVRNGDVVFRFGGDEFVILLRKANTARAGEIAERLRERIERRTFVIRQVRLKATVSVGLASYPEHTTDTDALIHLADKAMYLAKGTRNRVVVAEKPGRAVARKRRTYEPTL